MDSRQQILRFMKEVQDSRSDLKISVPDTKNPQRAYLFRHGELDAFGEFLVTSKPLGQFKVAFRENFIRSAQLVKSMLQNVRTQRHLRSIIFLRCGDGDFYHVVDPKGNYPRVEKKLEWKGKDPKVVNMVVIEDSKFKPFKKGKE